MHTPGSVACLLAFAILAPTRSQALPRFQPDGMGEQQWQQCQQKSLRLVGFSVQFSAVGMYLDGAALNKLSSLHSQRTAQRGGRQRVDTSRQPGVLCSTVRPECFFIVRLLRSLNLCGRWRRSANPSFPSGAPLPASRILQPRHGWDKEQPGVHANTLDRGEERKGGGGQRGQIPGLTCRARALGWCDVGQLVLLGICPFYPLQVGGQFQENGKYHVSPPFSSWDGWCVSVWPKTRRGSSFGDGDVWSCPARWCRCLGATARVHLGPR